MWHLNQPATNDRANFISDLRKNGPSVKYKQGEPIPLGPSSNVNKNKELHQAPTHVQPIPLGLTLAEIKALTIIGTIIHFI